MHIAFRLVCFICLASWLGSCAIVGRPDGGEKDVLPPQLDTLTSSANFETNVRPTELLLAFNEFIQLKNASKDIILTPTPISGKPKFIQRGRQVRVDLSEVEFRDSTTYQLLFGEAVQDFTEGNPAKNLKYVFSTGDYLDSLTVTGKVEQDIGAAPIVNALVGLYRSTSDTVLTKVTPDYFTRTDSTGRFLLDFLAPGEYYLAAYTDENGNYRYSAGSEQIAFLDTTIQVAANLSDTSYAMRLSAERPPLIVMRADQAFPGLIRANINQSAVIEVQATGVPGEVLTSYREADTLFVAYSPSIDTLKEVVITFLGQVDTAKVRKAGRASAPALTFAPAAKPIAGTRQLELKANLPLARFDESLISIILDSIELPKGQWQLDTLDRRLLRWIPHSDTIRQVSLTFLPGALRTVFDSTNRDSLVVQASQTRPEKFGEVELTLNGLDSGAYYVLEILDDKGKVERQLPLKPAARSLSPTTSKQVLKRLPGGMYTVRLIDDLNQDGRYSPGDRRLKRQPETTKTFPIQQVREDWVVEEVISVSGAPSTDPYDESKL